MPKKEIISEIERKHVITLLEHNKRVDGRTVTEIRPIEIETGLIVKAEGSARIKMGKTQVIVGVKTGWGHHFLIPQIEGFLLQWRN